jgi:DNA polymerase-3 subunit delta'
MHAHLLIGHSPDNCRQTVENLAKKLHAKILEFPILKIDDTRSLNNLIRLSFNEPTLIVCQNIHEAGEEALNAFLKNLEEPQANIYFVLTAPSIRKVLPTIVSRCEVVRVKNQEPGNRNNEAEEFTKLSMGERLAYIDKIKDREKAIEFTENLINYLHEKLHSQKIAFSKTAKNLRIINKTLSFLKANGNVALDLTNMVIRLV